MFAERLLIATLRLTRLDSLYLIRRVAAPAQDGWFRSFRRGESVDATGNPIPWYSYPAIEFLRGRVRPELSVFEYGTGNSTLWWASRAREVFAVEHDEAWFRKMQPKVPPNVTLRHVPLAPTGEYARSLLRAGQPFNLVVIDGRDRVECARVAPRALTDDGVIVFDNSDRAEYAEGYAALHSAGFRHIGFVGMTPIAAVKVETSIFYRSGNWLGI